ncbi:MAG: hypothetical protein HYX20_03810 [Candidatus Yanofskybacteria bacterium]|nr:hypothetical protein [Candidatus Yanofskybacteria bacterium]
MFEKVKSWASEKGALKRAEEERAGRPRRQGVTPEEIAAERVEGNEVSRKEGDQLAVQDKIEEEQRIQEAKRKFVAEKPKLEQRLWAIPAELENLKRALEESKGLDMRKILDKEFELNSALSPVDSTNPNRQREYEEWTRALKDSKQATQQMKADLGRRIDEYQKKIYELEKEKSEIEKRIQRGY